MLTLFRKTRRTVPIVPAVNQLLPVRPSPVEISEILGLILSFLNPSTLKQVAALVCRQWLLVANTLIYRHLHVEQKHPKSWENLEKKLLVTDELTIGRTITPVILIVGFIEGALWTRALRQVEVALLQIGKQSTGRQHRLASLNLNLECQLNDPLERILSCFNPGRLTKLSLDMPFRAGPISIGGILKQCPNLCSLSVSANKRAVADDIVGEVNHAEIAANSAALPSTPLPLQSLCFHNLNIAPNELVKLLPRLGHLVELRLLSVRPVVGADPSDLNDHEAGRLFWSSVAQHCPSLETIAFSIHPRQGMRYPVPVERFPHVSSWGLDSDLLGVGATLRSLMDHNVKDRLTSLEIIGRSNNSAIANNLRDDLLNQILRRSTHLLHFTTDQLMLTSTVLWDQRHYDTLWDCRQLRTLSIRLESRWNRKVEGRSFSSRHVFGYLSRICPMLQQLSLTIDCQVLALKSGLCLLTRLEYLERLTINVEGSFEYDLDQVEGKDFAWLQNYSSERRQPSQPASSLVSSFFSHASVSSSSSRHAQRTSSFERDCSDCINKNWCEATRDQISGYTFPRGRRTWMDTRRAKIRQQQIENDYCFDFGWEVPTVDGVKDFMIYGTFLDIEARLQGHLFQQMQERDLHQQQKQEHPGLLLTPTSPWPNMERVSFSYRDCAGQQGKLVRKYTELGVQVMKQLRPDIKISCEFT